MVVPRRERDPQVDENAENVDGKKMQLVERP